MLFLCCCRCRSSALLSGRVSLFLLPVDGVEPRDLLPVVEALEVVVAEGLALAGVVGVADALCFFGFGRGGRGVEVEKEKKGSNHRQNSKPERGRLFLLRSRFLLPSKIDQARRTSEKSVHIGKHLLMEERGREREDGLIECFGGPEKKEERISIAGCFASCSLARSLTATFFSRCTHRPAEPVRPKPLAIL